MRRTALALACVLCSAPAFAQHPELVGQVKAELQARGVDLSGPCGAFQITKRVAWQLRGEGAGLLDKPSGSNCQGFASDILAYPGTHIFDILIDAGGNNGPAWQDGGIVEAARYRPAFDPGDSPLPPPVVVLPPVIVPPATDLQATILAELRAHEAAEKAFRDSVKNAWDIWRPRLEAISKWIVGPIAGYLVAKKW